MTVQTIVPVEQITTTILTIRGQRVIIDADLARLYGVTTKRLNEQVKRNAERFPEDFMFTLTDTEKSELVANCDRFAMLKHSTALPHAFTEHGALMAANILNSPKAVEVSVYVVRAFVLQRKMLAESTETALRFERIERKLLASTTMLQAHDDQLTTIESQLDAVIEALNELRMPPDPPRRPLGFRAGEDAE